MGRADLECKFTSFSKNGGISLELVQLSPLKVICLFMGEMKHMVELDSSSTL